MVGPDFRIAPPASRVVVSITIGEGGLCPIDAISRYSGPLGSRTLALLLPKE